MTVAYPDNLLSHILELTEVNIYWKDRQGRYLGCNPYYLRTPSKQQSIDQFIGKTDFDLFDYTIAKKLYETDQQIMEAGENLTLEEEGIDLDGNPAIFLTKKQPLRDKEGNICGILGISIDITEKKMAEQLVAMKSSFIRNIQHDIRTPFTGLWSLAQHLWENETDPEKKKYLGFIAKSSEELFGYCNRIIEFAEEQKNERPIIEKQFDLTKLLQTIIDIEQPVAVHKKLHFSLEIEPKLPYTIISDEHRWFCIVLNLVSNALKFTHSGEVKVRLDAVQTDMQKRQALLELSVIDTGVGIPVEKQNLIYLPFYRLHPSNENRYTGLGLGLSLVKQFIAELAGMLQVESNENQGSFFKCIIPVKLPQQYGEEVA